MEIGHFHVAEVVHLDVALGAFVSDIHVAIFLDFSGAVAVEINTHVEAVQAMLGDGAREQSQDSQQGEQ